MTLPTLPDVGAGYFGSLPLVSQTFDEDSLTYWLRRANTGLLKLVAADDTPEELKSSAAYVCDGVADNVEIQEAIDSLPATGGEVVLLAGTYRLEELAPVFDLAGKSNITIRGVGRDFTILKPPATRSVRMEVFVAEGAAGATGITLSDLTLDGESPTYGGNYSDQPISFTDADNDSNRFERLWIKDWDSAGGSEKSTDTSGSNSLWLGCKFTGNHHTALRVSGNGGTVIFCEFNENGKAETEEGAYCGGTAGGYTTYAFNRFTGYGALGNGSGHSTVIGNTFKSVDVLDNDYNAINGGPTTAVISGNWIEGIGYLAGVGISGGGPGAIVIANNYIEGCSRHGINSISFGQQVQNNTIIGCSQETDDAFSGIYMGSNVEEAFIDGNIVRHDGGTKQHKYGLELVLTTGADGGIVVGQNDFRDSGRTADVLDAADGTIWPTNEQLDYAEITADQELTTTEADITGLSTATFYANSTYPRKLRVRAHFNISGGTGDRAHMYLTNNSNTHLDEADIDVDVSGDKYKCTLEWQGTITADTSFKVRGEEATSDAARVEAASTYPAFIEVLQAGTHV
jgi:hypothetical protein